MSAAATAAGYLYASGRLRGRGGKEQEEPRAKQEEARPKEAIRVAVLPQAEDKPRRAPKIEYKRRRWTAP